MGASFSEKALRSCCAGPGCGGMLGDGHVDDSPTFVPEDDEYEQEAERDRRHDEQIGGHDLVRVVGEEGPPGL